MKNNRASRLIGLLGTLATLAAPALVHAEAWDLQGTDQPKLELVMKLVVTCTSPELMGPSEASKDGIRKHIWPIVGGRFVGKGIRGEVIAGGGDFPVVRPDGVTIIDALYRLRTDDGVTIIIHNKGLAYEDRKSGAPRYRLAPEFTAPRGKYDWLNESVFISTLVVPVPPELRQAKGPNENDRIIEIYRVL